MSFRRFRMHRSLAAGVALCGLLSAAAPRAYAADPGPAATPLCAGLPSGGATIPGLKLFAQPIDDPGVLLLTQRLVHLDTPARRELLKSGAGSTDKAIRAQVDAAVRSLCLGEVVQYALLRTAVELGFVWDNVDDARLEAFVNGPLVVAIGAEAARASLYHDVVSAALRGLPSTEPDALPATQCSGADDAWMLREAKDPLYPHQALQAGEIGVVKVAVALDESGLVRSVRVRTAEVDIDPAKGGGQMVYAALVSAASARYRASNASCAPRAGEFVFKADYSFNGVAVGPA